MKTHFYLYALTGLVCLASTSCGSKNNVKAEVSKLNDAFPTAKSAPAVAPESVANPGSSQAVDVNAVVNSAVQSLKNNDHVGAVTYLNTVQQQKTLTAQQHIAVHETIEKVYADLILRADRGDPKAKAALAQLERQLSQ
ncbi:MAG: hypothetical protein HY298_13075 [Verrucomicrobia bacterium]|nr:hypothetical protein [Verrucomicrobiota bacterium]